MIHRFGIIAAKHLLKIILTHVPVAFQVLHNEFDFFLSIFYLFREPLNFELFATGREFSEGEFFFENVELSIIYAEKLNRVYGFKVDDRVCQFTSVLVFPMFSKVVERLMSILFYFMLCYVLFLSEVS